MDKHSFCSSTQKVLTPVSASSPWVSIPTNYRTQTVSESILCQYIYGCRPVDISWYGKGNHTTLINERKSVLPGLNCHQGNSIQIEPPLSLLCDFLRCLNNIYFLSRRITNMFIFQDLEPLEAAMTQCWACEGLIKVHPLVRSMLVPFQKLHSDWKICACSIQFARQTVCAVVQGLKVYQPDGQSPRFAVVQSN